MSHLKRQRVSQAAVILLLARILSIFFGIFVSIFIASRYGTSFATDAFFVAIMLPLNVTRIARSTLGASVIPIFSEVIKKRGDREAWKFASSLINLILLIGLVLSVVIAFKARFFVHLLAPGLSEEAKTVGAGFLVVLAPVICLNLASNLGESLSHTYNHFLYPAIGSLAINMGTILGLILLAGQFGLRGGCIGFFVGGLIQIAVLLYALKGYFRWYRPFIHLRTDEFRRVTLQFVPVLLCACVPMAIQWINQVFLSALGSGKISVLNYANNLVLVIPNLLVFSFMRAVFPTLTHKATSRNKNELAEMQSRVLRLTSLLVIPIMVGLLILIRPTVELVYFRGSMEESAIRMICNVSLICTLGIIFISLNLLQQALLFAMKRAWGVTVIMILTLASHCAFTYLFIQKLDYIGIAVAITLTPIVRFFMLQHLVKRSLGDANVTKGGVEYVKIIVAALLMGCVVWGTSYLETNYLVRWTSIPGQVFFIGHLVLIGVVMYAIVAYMLRIREFSEVFVSLRRLFR